MSDESKDIKCHNAKSIATLNQSFWNERWKQLETGWDIGKASPAIVAYMNQYPNKNAAILIPGCGNAYEAEYLLENGFANITLIDIAPLAVERLKSRFSQYPQVKILCEDFFDHFGQYDLIIEQTFFCAIAPEQRNAYVTKVASLLEKHGKLIGVLFDKVFKQAGPPFGGYASDYRKLFEPYFDIKTMNKCTNSIAPRADSEVFVNLIKK